jgi:pimeloyl-ACP methyl ester carboxylesterase
MIRIFVVLLALLFAAPAEAARVYVIMGQGGSLTSGGMKQLASRLARLPGLKVSVHKWKYPGVIIADIKRLPAKEPIILIGYSLGAHTTTYIAHYLPNREIALAVAYDPSIYSAVQFPAGPNIKHFLLYHNSGRSRLGHARIAGRQVQTTEISEGHLSVDYDQRLHARTIAAVRAVR